MTPGAAPPRPLAVFVPCQVWTLNEEIRRHWTWRSRVRKEVRQAAAAVANNAMRRRPARTPFTGTVEIRVTPVLKTLNQDAAGCVTVAKPAIDGLVDARVIPGDGPKIVRAVTFTAPERGEETGLWLTVTSTANGSGD